MSTYLSTGSTIQSGTFTMDDEQPPWVKNFVAKYAKQASTMRAKFGTYPSKALIFQYNAKSTVPVTNAVNAWALADYWTRLGEDMLAQAINDYKKTLSSRASEAAARVKPVVDKFKRDASSIGVGLSLIGWADEEQTAIKLWRLIRQYALDLSLAMWSGYNIERGMELALWSVKESAKAVGKALAKPMIAVLEAGDLTWQLIKWGTIGTVGLAFVWGASKIIKGRKT